MKFPCFCCLMFFVVVARFLQSWETFFAVAFGFTEKNMASNGTIQINFKKCQKKAIQHNIAKKYWISSRPLWFLLELHQVTVLQAGFFTVIFQGKHVHLRKLVIGNHAFDDWKGPSLTAGCGPSRFRGSKIGNHRHDARDICGAQVTHPPQHKHHPSLKIWWANLEP